MSDSTIIDKDDLQIKELFKMVSDWSSYFLSQWLKILIVGIFGGLIGIYYAWIYQLTYTARITFVVEDGKSNSSGLGSLASLAGQFGFDAGNGSTNGGVLAGDNIMLYFKSNSLTKEVLLSRYENSRSKTYADVYSEIYGLKTKWKNIKQIGNINFHSQETNQPYSRLQDSLLNSLISNINTNQFSIGKVDKKASFIEVKATMINEELAKKYCDNIVQKAVEKYIDLKTQRQKRTIEKLEKRVDSIAYLLNKKTASSADLQTSSSTMDINPLYKTGSFVALETTSRDKVMLSSIYSAAAQNLELAKFSLSQETPVIQIVDKSIPPLLINKRSKLRNALTFSFIFGFLSLAGLAIKRVIKKYI